MTQQEEIIWYVIHPEGVLYARHRVISNFRLGDDWEGERGLLSAPRLIQTFLNVNQQVERGEQASPVGGVVVSVFLLSRYLM